MSISERATPKIAEIPEHEQLLSEQFRIAGKKWADADANAFLLKEIKDATLEQLKQKLIDVEGEMPDSHAERRVKSRPEWEAFLREMASAKREANILKVKMQWINMKFQERQSHEANVRKEMSMTR